MSFDLSRHLSDARIAAGAAIIEASTGTKYTYSDLMAMSRSAALAIQEGSPGQTIGILSENSTRAVAALLGIILSGNVAVPLDTGLNKAALDRIIKHSRIKSMFYSERFANTAKRLEKRPAKLRLSDVNITPPSGGNPWYVQPVAKRPAAIFYTSGTSGTPLGALLSYGNITENALSVISRVGIKNTDTGHLVLPLHYIFGFSFLLTHLIQGACVVIDNGFMYPPQVLNNIDRYHSTVFAGVSSHYAILISHGGFLKKRLPYLKKLLQAGDTLPPEIRVKITSSLKDKRLYLMYGLTEASPRVTCLDPKLSAKKSGSVGKPLDKVSTRIVDEIGNTVRTGVTGILTIKGPGVMLGYWRNAALTRKCIRNGWLITDDLASMDKEGDIFIHGRKGRVVKSGGIKVDLNKLEKIISSLKSVLNVRAVPYPDKVFGKRIVLYVQRASASLTAVLVKKLLSEYVPFNKISVSVQFGNIPVKNTGKIDHERLVPNEKMS